MTAKITSDHLTRKAIVYVRQSTAAQVRENLESQRRQYALVDHARTLGFGDVELIDQDLGHSGSTLAGRIGFQRLVAQVSLGAVGAVLCLEASRLARNNRDWHLLIDLCSLAGALLIDPEGYLRSSLEQRPAVAGPQGHDERVRADAVPPTLARGEASEGGQRRTAIPHPGRLPLAGEGVLEKRPDLRTQQTLDMVFAKFRELGSVRQTLLWLREREMSLPKRPGRRLDAEVVWASPSYSTVLSILNNPIYAGAYAFGRTRSHTTIVDERAHVTRNHRKPRSEWTVLIQDHHAGYITWDEYEHNQKILAENANMKGRMVRGGASTKEGPLLAGLIRCGRCGRQTPRALLRQTGRGSVSVSDR